MGRVAAVLLRRANFKRRFWFRSAAVQRHIDAARAAIARDLHNQERAAHGMEPLPDLPIVKH